MSPRHTSVGRRWAIALLNTWYALVHEGPERRYERRIRKRMACGDPTNTLGVQIRDEAHIRAMADQWLAELVNHGLRPEHLCVEYGCGSLWCAEPVIRYLQPGRFIGLDTTDRFYELGRQRLGSLLTEKQVTLAVISRRTVGEVAALKPALVYSHRVLHHVPRHALGRYMRIITSLLHEQTILVIENTRRPSRDGSLKDWRYPTEDIQAYLRPNWSCRQESFGLVITHSGGSRSAGAC